ncbi:hypothetical protein C0993_005440 [Termitomyces sp. T159_Od127]|nr:hypothetical protein C0993_005440 [Termitomyces sp. T159_Od127]
MAHRSSKALQNVASVLDVYNSQTDAKSRASLRHHPRVLVKDPPRDQLPAAPAEDSVFLLTHFPGYLVSDTSGSSIYITSPSESHAFVKKSPRRRRVRMAKKRRSLQSLFIPSFFSAPPSPTTDVFSAQPGRARSQSMASQSYDHALSNDADSINITPAPSAADSPPPGFLLDDDPFANLSTVPAFVTPSPTPPPTPTAITPVESQSPVQTPRSPLTPHTSDNKPSFLSSPPPSSRQFAPGMSRTLSGRARPAYSKPAFAPRPSLPSLDTLARMNVRKGRVGARLPYEPWDQLDASRSSEESWESSTSQEASIQDSSHTTPTDSASDEDSPGYNSDKDAPTSRDEDPSTLTSKEPETSLNGRDELSCGAESEVSLDSSDSLDDDDYITSFELYLSCSTSTTSSSSISSPEYQWTSFNDPNDNTPSAEDSDILSPSSDNFIFPDSHFDSHNIISSYWSSDDLLDSLSGDVSASAVYSELFSKSDMNYSPGTSAGTIRPSTSTDLRDRSPSKESVQMPVDDAGESGELVDGSGRENVHGQASGRWEHSSGSNVKQASGNHGSGRVNGNSNTRFGGRGDDEDEDDKRRRINRSNFSTPSESEASASDEESTDDYGEPAQAEAPLPSSDDDVPLARCIPNALKAQNTIRRQVQEEREQRRAARAAARARSSSTPRAVTSTRPPWAEEPSRRAPMSSSHEAALHASRSLRRAPPKAVPTPEIQPFTPEDLTRRLEDVETREPSSFTAPFSKSNRKEASRPRSAGHGMKDPAYPVLASSTTGPPTDHRTLRPSRSFHRFESRKSEEHYLHTVPLPIDAGRKLGRSLTRREEGPSTSPRSFSLRTQDDNPSRPSLPRRSGEEPRKLMKYPEPRSARSSSEMERPRRTSPTRPPVPPLPPDALAISTSPPAARGPVVQQRVFIGDMQRFNMVEIGPSTNAGDVIEMVDAQGSLKGWVGSGDWMVWEVAQDYGMAPRPFSFAVKSTDKLSFFENTADYLHIFSCGEKEGMAWVEHILLARSYVLHQERNVLFNPKATSGSNAAGGSVTLSRAGTRKTSSAHRSVVQPLISGVVAPMTIAQQLQSNDVFEPGSLLRKHN